MSHHKKDEQKPSPKDESADDKGRQRVMEPRTYEDPVDDASDDSFPASDPPGWTDSTASRKPDSR